MSKYLVSLAILPLWAVCFGQTPTSDEWIFGDMLDSNLVYLWPVGSLIMPTYPPKAAREDIECKVAIKVLIDTSGAISKLKVVQERPAGFEFGESAQLAVQKWRFTTGYRDGQPAALWTSIIFFFHVRADTNLTEPWGYAGKKLRSPEQPIHPRGIPSFTILRPLRVH